MRAVLEAFPGAQRALFRRYHIGGCFTVLVLLRTGGTRGISDGPGARNRCCRGGR